VPTTKNIKQDAPPWREHVTQWRDNGLTQAAYGREYELCPHSFSYHKLKYSSLLVPVKPKSSGFVSVQILPVPQHHDPLTLYFTKYLGPNWRVITIFTISTTATEIVFPYTTMLYCELHSWH
jgi:hypothetical protein